MMMKNYTVIFFLLCFNCHSQTSKTEVLQNKAENKGEDEKNVTRFDTTTNTIHIMVALCDNKYQGIVPVPAKIGNGQDPDNNLYWGCGFGIRTYFKNSKEWKLLKKEKVDNMKLERLIFKHRTKNYYLIAEAYNGKNIKECTVDFLKSNAGIKKDTLHINNTVIGINGNAKLLAYIGHDGLMDFSLDEAYENADNKIRDCIILACISKEYFSPYIKQTKSNPLVWTTGLMAPEAYTVHDAISAYIKGESSVQIQNRAAMAYSKYQKCSLKAAKNLLATGW
ncbi:MAG: hypothetical protein WBP45_09565 [Daejeonella sp.]